MEYLAYFRLQMYSGLTKRMIRIGSQRPNALGFCYNTDARYSAERATGVTALRSTIAHIQYSERTQRGKVSAGMRKWVVLGSAGAATIAVDRVSKLWIISNLDLYQSIQPIPALAPFFQLTRSTNTGAAFGILPMAGDLFLLLALFIIAAMLWYFRGVPARATYLPVCIGIVIGGAVGNATDRLTWGHVIDFVHYQIPGILSNVSNLADHAIVLGVLLIVGESFWKERQRESADGIRSVTGYDGGDIV